VIAKVVVPISLLTGDSHDEAISGCCHHSVLDIAGTAAASTGPALHNDVVPCFGREIAIRFRQKQSPPAVFIVSRGIDGRKRLHGTLKVMIKRGFDHARYIRPALPGILQCPPRRNAEAASDFA
jgi:hypothetical protein